MDPTNSGVTGAHVTFSPAEKFGPPREGITDSRGFANERLDHRPLSAANRNARFFYLCVGCRSRLHRRIAPTDRCATTDRWDYGRDRRNRTPAREPVCSGLVPNEKSILAFAAFGLAGGA